MGTTVTREVSGVMEGGWGRRGREGDGGGRMSRRGMDVGWVGIVEEKAIGDGRAVVGLGGRGRGGEGREGG